MAIKYNGDTYRPSGITSVKFNGHEYLFQKSIQLTNLISASAMRLNGATVSGGVFRFASDVSLGMVEQDLPTPIAGHKYYGKVAQKVPGNTTFDDSRFEYYVDDIDHVATIVFTTFANAIQDDNWHWDSSIQAFTEQYRPSGYRFRSFAVNPTNTSYRYGQMIVDLTEAFGEGREPSKEWCDANIPYFEGTITIGNCDKLATPRISLDNNIVSWDDIPRITSYYIYIDNILVKTTTQNSIDLYTLPLSIGEHIIYVLAVGDGQGYLNSDFSNIINYTEPGWEYPVQTGNKLLITQVRAVSQYDDVIIIE